MSPAFVGKHYMPEKIFVKDCKKNTSVRTGIFFLRLRRGFAILDKYRIAKAILFLRHIKCVPKAQTTQGGESNESQSQNRLRHRRKTERKPDRNPNRDLSPKQVKTQSPVQRTGQQRKGEFTMKETIRRIIRSVFDASLFEEAIGNAISELIDYDELAETALRDYDVEELILEVAQEEFESL